MTQVGPEVIGEIAALCRRSIWNSPSEDELARALYPADQQTAVFGDPRTGVVAAVRDGGAGFVRLLVVAPDLRRIGRGRALLQAAEEWLGGTSSITLGADPRYSLWPGIAATDLALVCLAESAGYRREATVVTMEVDLKSPLPADPGGWEVAEVEHDGAIEALCGHAAASKDEFMRAMERGTLVVVGKGRTLSGMCAFDVNRAGTLGPLACTPDRDGMVARRTAVIGALRLMREWRHPRAEINDVGELRPFAELGAKVGKLSFVYRKATA